MARESALRSAASAKTASTAPIKAKRLMLPPSSTAPRIRLRLFASPSRNDLPVLTSAKQTPRPRILLELVFDLLHELTARFSTTGASHDTAGRNAGPQDRRIESMTCNAGDCIVDESGAAALSMARRPWRSRHSDDAEWAR